MQFALSSWFRGVFFFFFQCYFKVGSSFVLHLKTIGLAGERVGEGKLSLFYNLLLFFFF